MKPAPPVTTIRDEFVNDLRVGHQGAEAVCKSNGNEKLLATFRTQFHRDMLAIARRRTSQIDDDIDDFSTQNPNQFGLSERSGLKVKAAQRSGSS
jgi:hypothetical protein